MSYRDALEYLYDQLPMFQRIGPAAYKKDLGNTLALCAHLGNPHRAFRSIHVGGTNGKGSVSHMLAAACQAAGLKTGLYVSPHYKDFRERIKVDGRYITRCQVVAFVEKHRDILEDIRPSFFEMCVVMAFDHFARERVDVAVVEVGLGGRLDSTNVITPLLSVITNISFDHQNLLGDTLPQIAFEKAGIIKPGVRVVIGETHPGSAPVFLEKAREAGAEIVFADQHFQVVEKPGGDWESAVYDVFKHNELFRQNLRVDAAGPFQRKNIATALQAWDVLLQNGLLPAAPGRLSQAFDAGLARLRRLTRFIGRWQLIGRQPAVLCDSAHNEAGLRAVLQQTSAMSFRRVHIVLGFVNDKSVEAVLPLFPPAARYYFAKADIPRGLEASVLREKAAGYGLVGKAYVSVRNALKAARRAAGPGDLVLVTGSIFVVAEALPGR
ncbi:MAG: bifunctional folylpolyglutamate synthase/dihydrofolate synthase [Saprospirales bacterium]|nr:bifunctional folylpolyglutamate synthase/dihydrofolate synthase [Saprospirales bacterium]MBK8923381.1 bifunctional folylpolyglutamate synthase/dihydrofolate synthase [Saprospirales bacterium]